MNQVLASQLQAAFPRSGFFKDETPERDETVAEFFDRIEFDPCTANDNVDAFICNELYFHERDHVVESLDKAIADLNALRRQIHPTETEQHCVESSSTEVC